MGICSKSGTILLISRETELGACETTNLSSGPGRGTDADQNDQRRYQNDQRRFDGGRDRDRAWEVYRVRQTCGRGHGPFAAKREERCTKTQTYQPLLESHYAASAKPYGESREWLGPTRLTGQRRVGPRVRNRAYVGWRRLAPGKIRVG